ncbi:MAG: ATP-binding cassette domain-containing protein [Bacteriovoracia bacterium]
MIRVEKLSKAFGKRTILNEISLELGAKKTHILLGSSGSGKSTLLRMIMGLIRPDSGRIYLDENEMTPVTQPKLVREMGYVIQDGGLFPHLTAAENVSLAAKAFGMPQEQIESKLLELVRLVELEPELLKRFPKNLSGGQKQRISLMRALMLNPNILLLDEPLGALDPIVRSVLQNELKRIFNSLGKTVIFVTHDINEAAFFGDTITLMNEGKIEQHGSFVELAKNPSTPFVKEFLDAQKPSQWLKEVLL